ncbi:DnaJ domain protein [Rubripirellula amarantea]|uniref:DnaJ domain protein n=1 Tax=Rubripirellula amarantea TaxID=2527999 RepID=A0A5C5WI60_9BACT|nr:J domain-containing protein [Rubripirellula amarantea]TWT50494.1 DnaJ domain protein [Rubripirellula amarantea]
MNDSSSPDSEPSWDKLPNDPRGFFGLTRSNDFAELKSAYKKLLRRFKPEKFPDEFQKIRAAYESLSEQLRYASPSDPMELDSPALDSTQQFYANDAAPSDLNPDRGDAVSVRPSALEELSHRSPPQIYQQLQDNPNKSDEDYLALAVLSDIAPTSPENDFWNWLLRGIADHPRSVSLLQCVRSYCNQLSAWQDRANALTQASKVIPPDRYFSITESVWDRLLREAPFDDFKSTLEQSERNLGILADRGRLIFFVHLLPAAIWKADPSWFQGVREQIEDSFFDLPHWAQDEVEFVDQLSAYQTIRAEFTQTSAIAQQIDSAIVAFCCEATGDADAQVLQTQYEISGRGLYLMQDLPTDLAGGMTVYWIWERIVDDVDDRIAVHDFSFDTGIPDDELKTACERMMYRVGQRWEKSATFQIRTLSFMVLSCLTMLGLVTCVSLLIRAVMRFLDSEVAAGFADLGMTLVTFIVAIVIVIAILVAVMVKTKLPYSLIRFEVFKLFRVVPATMSQAMAAIGETQEAKIHGEVIDNTDEVVNGMANDPAAWFFARAVQTLNS